ncbi:MAG: type I methionyl aminopeptidase, partial [Rickettsiales bacterium]|nr:type I methionyl aminopeptidase [Rickettsiales bacterium]
MPEIKYHSKDQFEKMRIAGKLAAEILDYITDYVNIGVTTDELNTLCHNKIIENNAIPAPLNYRGFPKSICTSVNHVICHGIPSDKKLKDGDIINIDVTVIVDGWYGDTSRMYYVGKPSIKAKRLCDVTFDAMMLGIEQVKPGNTLGD